MTNTDQTPQKNDLGSQVKAVANAEWGFLRRSIAAHPLTASWVFYAMGIVVGMAVEYQLFLANGH